jgi:uncharacterized iron-regulated membrane protein
MRRVFLTIHLWAGLIAALFLLALGVSGSLVAFENEIDRALNSKLTWVDAGPARLTLAEMIAKLEAANSGYTVAGFGLSDRDDVAWGAFLANKAGDDRSVAFNPYTGAILGDESTRNRFTGKVHQFHLRLLAGRAGSSIVTVAAVFLLVLAMTGLVLWWPRKVLAVSWRHPWKKLNLDLHQMLGLYTSVFLIVFALTAMVIHWDDETQRLVNRVSGAQEEPRFPKFQPLSPTKPAPDFDAILATAQKAEPDARATTLVLNANPARILMKHPGDHTPAGRTIVLVDAYTRNVVMIVDWRTASPGFRLVKLWNREVHTGDIGGLPTRILAATVSLSLPVLTITGPLIWWHRRRGGTPVKQAGD